MFMRRNGNCSQGSSQERESPVLSVGLHKQSLLFLCVPSVHLLSPPLSSRRFSNSLSVRAASAPESCPAPPASSSAVGGSEPKRLLIFSIHIRMLQEYRIIFTGEFNLTFSEVQILSIYRRNCCSTSVYVDAMRKNSINIMQSEGFVT